MPPKKDKCFTKPKKDGGTYTTCLSGQKKPKKKIKLIKKEEPKPKPKKKIKLIKKEEPKAKPKAPAKPKTPPKKKMVELPELKAVTGLTKAEANKLSAVELFGMLPKELAKDIVLNPKATGVKVAQDKNKFYEQELDRIKTKKMPSLIEKEKKRLIEGKFGVKELKAEAKKYSFPTTGYKKNELIQIIANEYARKESGFTKLRSEQYDFEIKEEKKEKQRVLEKKRNEIKEAIANPPPRNEKRITEYKNKLRKILLVTKGMDRRTYGNQKEESIFNHQYRYRDVLAYV